MGPGNNKGGTWLQPVASQGCSEGGLFVARLSGLRITCDRFTALLRLAGSYPGSRWRPDLFQQLTRTLADQGRFIVGHAISMQQSALDFFVYANELKNLFAQVLHVDLPGRGTNLHEISMSHGGSHNHALDIVKGWYRWAARYSEGLLGPLQSASRLLWLPYPAFQ